jgi:hypothetical protein
MKYKLRAVLYSLAAILAVGSFQAIAASGASASVSTPHFGEQLPQNFSFAGKELAFEASGASVQCKTVSGSTEISSFSSLGGSLRFQNCAGMISGIPFGNCTTAGAASGEILTSRLDDNLVYISSARHEVGMLLFQPQGSPLATFKCGGSELKLRGSVLTKASPLNTWTFSFQLAAKGSKGTQELTQYEGPSGEKLTASLEESIVNGAYKSADLNAVNFELQATTKTEIIG